MAQRQGAGAQFRRIKDGIVNIFLIDEPEGLTLIDAGTVGGPRAVGRALARAGRTLADVRRILITHADPDHFGGLPALAAAGARVYASAIEAAAIARGTPSRDPQPGPGMRPLFALTAALWPLRPARVDEVVGAGDELPILGGLQVLATPGHTPGHLSFYAPAYGLLFAGDSMMALGGRLSFRDGPVTWDYAQGRESNRRQAALGARVVCCGHGPVLRDEQISFPS